MAHLTPEGNWARVRGPLDFGGHYGRDWNGIHGPIYTNFTVVCDFSSDLSSVDLYYKGNIFCQVTCVAHDHE